MASDEKTFTTVEHQADFCVVGGGMAGVCAALAAARHGARTVLIHDRPVLGGNASSECRVHVCGADRHLTFPHLQESGLVLEMRLANLAANPNREYPLWDLVLYDLCRQEPNLTVLLNCSVQTAEADDRQVQSVTGWQVTTEQWHRVSAGIFADCSGDGVLAPLVGAPYRIGREAREEFGESIAPEQADSKTMGMTILFQARKHETPQPYTPPAWVRRFDSCDELPEPGDHRKHWQMGYWWVELGGQDESITPTEDLRDRLLAVALGVWDHIKNRCEHTRESAANWALCWVQMLPAKRESRRYIGAHVLNQNDIEAGGPFHDVVAYGGWSMDDHHPAGFEAVRLGVPATVYHHAPSPYGIPYRCLRSAEIENLMFAGRCHSATHAALSSTRVMATGAVMGQAVGTAAAIATREGLMPADVDSRIQELQQTLLADDCFLPAVPRKAGRLTASARIEATCNAEQAEAVRDGINRPLGADTHAWAHGCGDTIALLFDRPEEVGRVNLLLDSDFDRDLQMSYHRVSKTPWQVPPTLVKRFGIEGLRGGQWQVLVEEDANVQRHVVVPVKGAWEGIRFVPRETHGADRCRLYGFYVD